MILIFEITFTYIIQGYFTGSGNHILLPSFNAHKFIIRRLKSDIKNSINFQQSHWDKYFSHYSCTMNEFYVSHIYLCSNDTVLYIYTDICALSTWTTGIFVVSQGYFSCGCPWINFHLWPFPRSPYTWQQFTYISMTVKREHYIVGYSDIDRT